jgi:predicted Zn-dependent peptidase
MIKTHTLSNGIRLITDTNSLCESISFGVWVGVGARFETPEINGISHVLEHMAFKGTTTRTAFDISREIEDVGGIMNAYTGRDVTAYYVKVLKSNLGLGMNIIADILQNSIMDKKELDREKGVIIQEINMSNDTPDDLVFDLYSAAAYPNQPLGRTILGTPDTVRAVTSETLLMYMKSQYSAGRMIISVAGDFDEEQMVSQCEEMFAQISKGDVKKPEPAKYKGGSNYLSKANEQVNLVVGFEGCGYTHPDYYASAVLASLFGGGMSSRLFQEIREKRGLVYSIYAFNAPESDTGTFGIYAGTGEKEVAELIPVLCDEILALSSTIKECEVQRAKQQLKARLLMREENWNTHAEGNAMDMLIRGRIVPKEEVISQIEALDVSALQAAARRIFSGVPTVAALGPINRVLSYEHICERLKNA